MEEDSGGTSTTRRPNTEGWSLGGSPAKKARSHTEGIACVRAEFVVEAVPTAATASSSSSSSSEAAPKVAIEACDICSSSSNNNNNSSNSSNNNVSSGSNSSSVDVNSDTKSSGDGRSGSKDDQRQQQYGGGSRKRNKRGKKEFAAARAKEDALKVCMAVAEKGPGHCPWPEGKCKFSHDLAGFMTRRPSDLGPRCIHYDLYGFCRFGALCRFGQCHIVAETGINLERSTADGGVLDPPPPMNVLPKDVQLQLRKYTYPFKCPRSGDLNNKKAGGGGKKAKTEAANDTSSAETAAAVVEEWRANPSAEPLPERPVKLVDFRNKVYIAPLTTVGNLPFRRIMKHYGADITCGEMAMATNLLNGQQSEWALLKRHPSEDIFGVQIAAAHGDQFTRCAELLEREASVDFVDVNMGCPIDLVVDKGCGSALMTRQKKIHDLVRGLTRTLSCCITLKMRVGWNKNVKEAHNIIRGVEALPESSRIAAFMIHGRSRQQRYAKLADWRYIRDVANGVAHLRDDTGNASSTVAANGADGEAASWVPRIPIIGNGDIYSYTQWEANRVGSEDHSEESKAAGVETCCMLARGALIKPWLPTEIKEKRHWDISATERLDMLKQFVHFGLEHWGSDQKGVDNVRRFLLEWMSFLHRYIPIGLLEYLDPPPMMTDRPPPFCGRSDLETLLASKDASDWVKVRIMTNSLRDAETPYTCLFK